MKVLQLTNDKSLRAYRRRSSGLYGRTFDQTSQSTREPIDRICKWMGGCQSNFIDQIAGIIVDNAISNLLQSQRIQPVHGIIQRVAVKVGISATEQDWIFGRPPPRLCIIIPRPKARQLGVRVVEAAGEAKGLEAGVIIEGHAPEGVVG